MNRKFDLFLLASRTQLLGIAAYVKALRPDIKVIGVEADDAAGRNQRVQDPVPLQHLGSQTVPAFFPLICTVQFITLSALSTTNHRYDSIITRRQGSDAAHCRSLR